MIDEQPQILYNEDRVSKIAEQAAETAVAKVMLRMQSMYIENQTRQEEEQHINGDVNMPSKIHQRVSLPNGEHVWCNGATLSAAIANVLAAYLPEMSKTPENEQTFQEYAEYWYSTYHKPKVKTNTAVNTRTYLNKYIYPCIGNILLHKISFKDIQEIFTSMNDKSASTAAKVKITLHAVFSNALEDGLLQKNIMDSDRYVLPTRKDKRKALTRREFNDIASNLYRIPEDDRLLIAFALYTGMRRGEILALKWDHIDFENRLIYVDSSVTFINNRPTITSTKSKAGIRQIPLDKNLKEILKGYVLRTGYVIKNLRDPSIPVTETGFQRMFERAEKAIDLHGATMHVFRHTYATLMKPNCDIKTLQKIMGHSDIKVTMDTYVDPIDEDIQKMSDVSIYCAPNVHQKASET